MSADVLRRIQTRLDAVGLTEARAPKLAGLSDSAIRNVRRKIEAGEDAKFAVRTIEALAPVLQTSVAWLLGEADEPGPAATAVALDLVAIVDRLDDQARDALLQTARALARANQDGAPAPGEGRAPKA